MSGSCRTKRFGLSPSSVGGMSEPRDTKNCTCTHARKARAQVQSKQVQSKQRRATANENYDCFSARI